jgi:hypothetical protein
MRETPPVFVFGSNLAGRHGKGASLWARQHRGAIYGQGTSLQGNSNAIPTKDGKLRSLPLGDIARYVNVFLSRIYRYFYALTCHMSYLNMNRSQVYPTNLRLLQWNEAKPVWPVNWGAARSTCHLLRLSFPHRGDNVCHARRAFAQAIQRCREGECKRYGRQS